MTFDRDTVGALIFLAFGVVAMVWGIRQTLGAGSAGAGQHRLVAAGVSLWQRVVGAALVMVGAIALLAGVYLLLDLRNL